MAVRLRMQKLGRAHQPFFRVVAVDSRAPRDGKVIEFLGHYDPLVPETDARAVLKNDKIDRWLSVGAQPSEKVGVLIRKYGTNGTHLEQQKAAIERLAARKPTAPPPMVVPKPKAEEPVAEGSSEAGAVAETEETAVAEEPAVAEETPAAEASAEGAAEEKSE